MSLNLNILWFAQNNITWKQQSPKHVICRVHERQMLRCWGFASQQWVCSVQPIRSGQISSLNS